MIRYRCVNCGATLERPSSLAGMQDRCPLCGATCGVPKPRRRAVLVLAACGGAAAVVIAVLAVLLWPRGNKPKEASPGRAAARHQGEGPNPLATLSGAKQLPKLGPPPKLPPSPAPMEWSKDDKKKLDEVRKNYAADQVSAYLEFREILERKKDPPTPKQKQWLQKAMEIAKPRAVAVLRRDFKQAAPALDLRGCTIIMAVANKVQKGALREEVALHMIVKGRVLSGRKIPRPIWEVSDVKGIRLEGAYEEEGHFGKTRIRPKEGFRLLRVSARVKNISAQSDPPYTPWVLWSVRRGLVDVLADDAASALRPRRLAADDFLFLLTRGDAMITCGHICKGCKKLRGFVVTLTPKGGSPITVFGGRHVRQGVGFKADVLFTVPEGQKEFRLLVLGAAPVPVKMGK